MAKAFKTMQDDVMDRSGDRPLVDNIVLFITDGFPTKGPQNHDPRPMANLMKTNNMMIYGLGVTERVNATIMKQVVSQPSSRFFSILDDYRDLEKRIYDIITALCDATPARTKG